MAKRFIKFVVKSLMAMALAIGGFVSIYAQQCPTDTSVPHSPPQNPPPLDECQLIANGKGTFWQSKNAMGASIRLYIMGKPTDIYKPSYAMEPLIYRDVLIMRLGYYAPRKIRPMSVNFELMSYSPTAFKYEANHKITIYLDDNPLLSKDAEATSLMVDIKRSINIEKFTVEMEFGDFLKFTEAKNITIQLGETKIKLKSEDIEALNELNKTTKELKFPPPYPIL